MTVSGTTSRISLVACTLWLATIPAHAVDLNSQDLIPAPAGTDAILAYFTYATRDSFTPTGGDEIKQGTGLDSFVSIFRYVHYMDVGGFTVAPQVLMPYGRLYNGSQRRCGTPSPACKHWAPSLAKFPCRNTIWRARFGRLSAAKV